MGFFESIREMIRNYKKSVADQEEQHQNPAISQLRTPRQSAEKEKKAKDWEERRGQVKSFSISDMYQFPDIPFGWHWVTKLEYTNDRAWFMLNKNNQQIALEYISQLAELIENAHGYVKGIKKCRIDLNAVSFGYRDRFVANDLPSTYVACEPFTRTGKISKYPAILYFSTIAYKELQTGEKVQIHPAIGQIKILRDGNIGSAHVTFSESGYIKFTFGLFGLSLVIKRIDSMEGKIFDFNDLKEEW